jgi:hypothetical protein
MSFHSRAREEERRQADQVQGPLQPRALHPCPQGQRQGREAQAVPPSRYAKHLQSRIIGRTATDRKSQDSPLSTPLRRTPAASALLSRLRRFFGRKDVEVQDVGRLWYGIIERRGDASVALTTTRKTSKLHQMSQGRLRDAIDCCRVTHYLQMRQISLTSQQKIDTGLHDPSTRLFLPTRRPL